MKARIPDTMRTHADDEEMSYIRRETSSILCWCANLALHQKFGYGKQTQEAFAMIFADTQQLFSMNIMDSSYLEAMEHLKREASRWAEPVFKWPGKERNRFKNRAERLRYQAEKDNRDEVCTSAWCMFVIAWANYTAMHRKRDAWGRKRFEKLRAYTDSFMLGFLEEAEEYGRDVAYEHLRRACEQLMKEETRLEEESTEESREAAQAWVDEVKRRARDAILKDRAGKITEQLMLDSHGELCVLSNGARDRLKDELHRKVLRMV